jgi:hypothetical protein
VTTVNTSSATSNATVGVQRTLLAETSSATGVKVSETGVATLDTSSTTGLRGRATSVQHLNTGSATSSPTAETGLRDLNTSSDTDLRWICGRVFKAAWPTYFIYSLSFKQLTDNASEEYRNVVFSFVYVIAV